MVIARFLASWLVYSNSVSQALTTDYKKRGKNLDLQTP